MNVSGNSGFFAAAGQAVDNVVDSVQEKLNPKDHAKMKNGLQTGSKAFQIAAIAMGVAAAIFVIIAISVASVGSIFPLALGALCGFGAYNSAQLSKNIETIAKAPASYKKCYGVLYGVDKDRLRKDLAVNTFGMNFLIKIFVDEVDKACDSESRKRNPLI